jgi:hypothetical protein
MNSYIGLFLIAVGALTIYLDRPNPEPKNWKTLVIWRTDDWKVGAMSWFDGALTKDQIEKSGYAPTGFKVMETVTVNGFPASAEQIQSLASQTQ